MNLQLLDTNGQPISAPPQSELLNPTVATLRDEPAGRPSYSDASRPVEGTTPTSYDHAVWGLGWSDGRADTTKGIENPASYFTNEAKLAVKEAIRRRIPSLERARQQQALATTDISACDEKLKALEQLEKRMASYSISVSRTSYCVFAVLLLLAGILLMIADLPLTAQLAGKSLGFTDAVCLKDGNVVNVNLSDCTGTILRAEKIVFFLPTMLYYFPEILMLAIGLMASGFLFKACIEIIARHHQHWREHFMKIAGALCMATLMICTLAVLGIVRAQTFTAETEVKIAKRDSFQSDAKVTEAADDKKNLQNKADVLSAEIVARQGPAVIVGFILITILFPISSGILLYLSAGAWHRYLACNGLAAKRSELKADKELLASRLADAAAAIKSAEHEIAELGNSQGIEALGEQWATVYEHGRERGALAKQTLDMDPSPYQRALYAIERRLRGAAA